MSQFDEIETFHLHSPRSPECNKWKVDDVALSKKGKWTLWTISQHHNANRTNQRFIMQKSPTSKRAKLSSTVAPSSFLDEQPKICLLNFILYEIWVILSDENNKTPINFQELLVQRHKISFPFARHFSCRRSCFRVLLCRRTTLRKEKANITIKFNDFYESTASCVLVDVGFIDDFMGHTRWWINKSA